MKAKEKMVNFPEVGTLKFAQKLLSVFINFANVGKSTKHIFSALWNEKHALNFP